MEKDIEPETDVEEDTLLPTVDEDEETIQKSRVLQIKGWEFQMHPHHRRGWTVRWTKTPGEIGPLKLSEAQRIMDYIEKAAHLFDEAQELIMMASTAVDPSYSYDVEGIARRAEVDDLETFYYDRFAVTN